MSLQITTLPTTEPVTVDEVRKILRLATFDDNDIIGSAISTAREFVEKLSQWSLVQKSYSYSLEKFPACNQPIELPRPPLLSVESVEYLDSSYVWQTWNPAEYFVADSNVPALLEPKEGFVYPKPVKTSGSNTVRIAFTVGAYVNDLKLSNQAIANAAIHFYEHPEVFTADDVKEMPLGVHALVDKMSKPHYRF